MGTTAVRVGGGQSRGKYRPSDVDRANGASPGGIWVENSLRPRSATANVDVGTEFGLVASRHSACWLQRTERHCLHVYRAPLEHRTQNAAQSFQVEPIVRLVTLLPEFLLPGTASINGGLEALCLPVRGSIRQLGECYRGAVTEDRSAVYKGKR